MDRRKFLESVEKGTLVAIILGYSCKDKKKVSQKIYNDYNERENIWHIRNNDLSQMINSEKAIVLFGALWCGPCDVYKEKQFYPLANQNRNSNIRFGYVDIGNKKKPDNRELISQFSEYIPCVVIYRDGKVEHVFREPLKEREKIEEFLSK